MVKVCPSCRSEFVSSATRCNDCDVDLVSPDALEDVTTFEDARERLKDAETVKLSVSGGLNMARELEKRFQAEEIVCFIDAEEAEGAVLGAAAMHYFLVVDKEDAERVGAVLKQDYQAMIEREGVGEFNTEAVDLEESEVSCPACGHKGALVDGACGDCGLFLDAPS